MPALTYRPEARIDLKATYRYVAEFNPAAAEQLIRTIDEKARLLAVSPLLGVSTDELAHNLRRFPIGHYTLFYRATDDGIEVIRVLHGARDIESLFSG